MLCHCQRPAAYYGLPPLLWGVPPCLHPAPPHPYSNGQKFHQTFSQNGRWFPSQLTPQRCATSFTTAEPPGVRPLHSSQHTGRCLLLLGSFLCLGAGALRCCECWVEGNELPASTRSPGTSVWALWPLPTPKKGKRGRQNLWRWHNYPWHFFPRTPPPSNKPLGLPRGEQCRVGVRGGLQRGEQALGTPVFRRGRPQRRGGWRNGDKGENGCSALSALQARLGYVPTIWNKSSLSRGYFWHTLSSL